jgi:hypothetical protein
MGYEQQLTWAYAMQCLRQTCSDAGFPKTSGQDYKLLPNACRVVLGYRGDCFLLIRA